MASQFRKSQNKLLSNSETMEKCAQNHSCSKCTHKYKETADRVTDDDPAAVLGVDENHQVPARDGAELGIQDAAQPKVHLQLRMLKQVLLLSMDHGMFGKRQLNS
jgi:hypothetical protein